MPLARTRSVSLEGVRGHVVEIEADLASGLPQVLLVGLPDASLAEARDRCRAAVVNSGCPWPQRKVTIGLSPASLPKAGAHYDLAIAVAVIAASGMVPAGPLEGAVLLGELALDGRLRAVPGVLPATLAVAQAGLTRVLVPEANVGEASQVDGVQVVGARSLRHVVALLLGEEPPDDPPVEPLAHGGDRGWRGEDRVAGLDLRDVLGQRDARFALEVTAAGGHHLLLHGPPGRRQDDAGRAAPRPAARPRPRPGARGQRGALGGRCAQSRRARWSAGRRSSIRTTRRAWCR